MTAAHRDRHLKIIAELQKQAPCQKDHSKERLTEHSFGCYPDEIVKATVAAWKVN